MKIFNTGKRIIAGVKPTEAGEFKKEEGDALLKMYPSELAKTDKNSKGEDTKALTSEVKKLKAELTTLEAKIVDLEESAETSLKTISDLEDKLVSSIKIDETPTETAQTDPVV